MSEQRRPDDPFDQIHHHAGSNDADSGDSLFRKESFAESAFTGSTIPVQGQQKDT